MFIAMWFILGLFFGSFANALVWRVHAQQKSSKARRSKDLSILRGRSMCPYCRHQLSAKDLVPVLSWLSLRGRCRYCHKSIHWQYPLVEIISAGLFVLSYVLMLGGSQPSVSAVIQFGLWLVILTGLIALTVYDFRWMLLPNRIIYPLVVVAAVFASINIATSGWQGLLNVLYAVGIAGGMFFLLYQVSSGKWIGGGDVKLGVLIGLMALDPFKAFLVLFLASTLGTLVIMPGLVLKRINAKTRIPFGPFLILATIIVVLYGDSIITWYKISLLGL